MQDLAQLLDGGVEVVVEVDKGVAAPEALLKLFAQDYLAGLVQKGGEQLEGLFLQQRDLLAPAQLSAAQVELKAFESDAFFGHGFNKDTRRKGGEGPERRRGEKPQRAQRGGRRGRREEGGQAAAVSMGAMGRRLTAANLMERASAATKSPAVNPHHRPWGPQPSLNPNQSEMGSPISQ